MDLYEFITKSETTKLKVIEEVKNLKERDIVKDIYTEIDLFKTKKNKRVFLFYGLRGIGKSTALQHYILKNKDVMYLDGSEIAYYNLDLLEIIDEYKKINNSNILIIDELNEIKDWGQALKIIHDRENLKVIATGSSAIKISKELDKIARRSIIKKLQALSFKEFLRLKYSINTNFEKDIKEILFSKTKDAYTKVKNINIEILKKDPNIEKHFREYLFYGFPLAINTDNKITNISKNIIYKIIVDDFKNISGFNLDSIDKAKKIIRSLAESIPGFTSLDKLSNNFKVSVTTVSNIIKAFSISELIIETFVNKKAISKYRKEPKILFSSSAIRYGLVENNFNNTYLGNIREDAFVAHMIYKDFEVNYIEENKKSADYLITNGDKSVIVEIGGKNKKTKQLDKSFIITESNKIDIIDNIVYLPLYLICLI